MAAPSRGRSGETLAFALACGLIIACFLFGGSARADAYSQFFVRSGAVLFGAAALVTIARGDLAKVRIPFALLGAWTLLIAFQLVPLPPVIWTNLPGRDEFVPLAGLAGISQPWREISLVPDATLNSLLAMIVPLAALVAVSQVSSRYFAPLLALLVGLALLSGLIGVVQVSAGGAVYFYEISNRGNAVGLFANRNHQAAMLAATVPFLAGLASLRHADAGRGRKYGVLAFVVFLLIFPLVFVTGSRSGVVLLLLGVGAAALVLTKVSPDRAGRAALRPFLIAGAVAVAVAAAALAVFRVGAVDRILTRSIEEDLRFSLLSTMMDMAAKYFPIGGGFGAFPDLFKVDEPFFFLNDRYFNHAHNDALEILIEGGLPAALIALAALVWLSSASLRIWRAPYSADRPHQLYGLVASAALWIVLLASLVDYPLRTPALAAWAAVAAAFVARAEYTLTQKSRMIVRERP